MDLIFLHGPPAVGKRTVAHALRPMLSARLLENHDSIDLAKTILDFGAPGFWELVGDLRLSLLKAATASDLPYLITTACYGHPEDLPIFTTWEDLVAAHSGKVIPVHLHCSARSLYARIGKTDRVQRGKLISQAGLRNHLESNDYRAVPRPNVIDIDTDQLLPDQAAQYIAARIATAAPARSR